MMAVAASRFDELPRKQFEEGESLLLLELVAHGVELEFQARLPHLLSTRASYAYSNSNVSRSLESSLLGLRVPQVPRHVVEVSLESAGLRFRPVPH